MTPDERLIRDEILAISEVDGTKCMHGGKCSASCPAYDVMDIKPHQFPSYMAHGEIRELMNSTTIWECLGCSTCIERCPRNVKPGKLIDGVRQAVIRQRGGSHLYPEQIPAMVDPQMPQQLLVSVLRRERK